MAAKLNNNAFLPTPEQFLADYHPIEQELCNLLRDLVKQALPNVIERVRPGWRLIGYNVPNGKRNSYIGWIAPFKGGADIGFEYGVLLDDPDRLLIGADRTVKQVRWITIWKPSDIRPDAFARLIKQAAEVAVRPGVLKIARAANQPTAIDRAKWEKM